MESNPNLKILAYSYDAGVYIVSAMKGRQIFVMGHSEYDKDTLKKEYQRDLAKGLDIDVPVNYFYNDDPQQDVKVTWRSHGNLLFFNWLNYYVYQETPYILDVNEK